MRITIPYNPEKDEKVIIDNKEVKYYVNEINAVSCINKLGQLEDIEEEIGFEKSGSSLLAFLQTPYIKSIMKLYVSARKELENE